MTKTKTPNGAVIYRGPSAIDGCPIVVILTGIRGSSTNPKTGRMVQSWILRDEMHPVEALKTGADRSICGNCPHRPDADGKRGCYVNPMGPSSVWRAYRAGRYAAADPHTAAEWILGRRVRFGSYGDPAAAPVGIWRILADAADGHTGYSHQWRTADPQFRHLCMASVESTTEAADAHRAGWRTFRVRSASDDPVRGLEIDCPASDESGKLTTCERCGLCSGSMSGRSNRIPSVSIVAHGIGRRAAESRIQSITIGATA